MYHLSPRSLKRLQGVDERLRQMVAIAIEITSVDFGVTSGVRTIDEQQKLVDEGKSQTLKSKHISGYAVDLVAYEGNKITCLIIVDVELKFFQRCRGRMLINKECTSLVIPLHWRFLKYKKIRLRIMNLY